MRRTAEANPYRGQAIQFSWHEDALKMYIQLDIGTLKDGVFKHEMPSVHCNASKGDGWLNVMRAMEKKAHETIDHFISLKQAPPT